MRQHNNVPKIYNQQKGAAHCDQEIWSLDCQLEFNGCLMAPQVSIYLILVGGVGKGVSGDWKEEGGSRKWWPVKEEKDRQGEMADVKQSSG
jgi:hypothetical protein